MNETGNARASAVARVIRAMLRRRLKSVSAGDNFVKRSRDRINSGAAPTMLPRGVSHRALAVDELGPAHGEWVGVRCARRHVVYLHGGYYIAGRPRPYRNVAGRLAAGLGAEVMVLDYPLAPESPYPAAVDQVAACYRSLLGRGVDPASVAFIGDSAGGGLAVASLLRTKSEGVPLPGAAVLFSPWTDLTCSGPSIERNDHADDMLSAAALRAAAAEYTDAQHLENAEVSPLFGDLAGLAPMFVTVDRSETLLDDALRLVERARNAGTRCELRETSGLFHIWPIHVPYLREARATVADVIAFLDRKLA